MSKSYQANTPQPLILWLAMLCCCSAANAQFAGSRGGVQDVGSSHPDLPVLTPEQAESYITIEGTAEVRLKPTQLRIVLAVTSEAEDSQECSRVVKQTIANLRQSWTRIGVGQNDVYEDFIASLPRYEWKIEERDGETLGVEKKAGYQMQTNLHVAVPDDAKAQQVLELAFQNGVTDIIAFDYWSRKLDATKVAARKAAVQAARAKAGELLGSLFDQYPPVINIQEKTETRFPRSMYTSFENTYGVAPVRPSRRDIPFIGAYRPKNTYYEGPTIDADSQSTELAMRPEISVVSTVRIFYRSPAADMRSREDAEATK